MDVNTQVKAMDALVTKGAIVEAVETFFSENAKTDDYGDVKTQGKAAMVDKMNGFVGSIAKVNGITHHATTVAGNRSASEFTFDFDMKDGSKVFWHEIIRRVWDEEGKVIEEEYFLANN